MSLSYKYKLIGASLFSLLFLLIGNIKNAEAVAETCIWTDASGSDIFMSTVSNWQKEGGGPCADIGNGDTLKFTGTAPGVVDDAEWDSLMGMVSAVIVDSNYTGHIQVAADATVVVTGNIAVNGGTFINSSANQTMIGSLNIGAAGILAHDGAGGILVAGAIDNAGAISDSSTIDVMGSFTNSGTYTKNTGFTGLVVRSDFTNDGSFTDTTGELVVSSTASNFGGTGLTTLKNFRIGNSAPGSGTSIVTFTGNVTSTNLFSVTDGSSAILADKNLVVGGHFSVGTGGSFSQTTGTTTMSGNTKNLGDTFGANGTYTFGNLEIDGSVTLYSNVSSTNNIVVNSGKTLLLNNNTLRVGGSLNVVGSVSDGSGVIRMTGNNAMLGGSGTLSIDQLRIVSGTTTLAGDMTIQSLISGVDTFPATFNLSSKNLTISGGGINNSGTIMQSSGLLTMSGSGNLYNSNYAQFASILFSGTITLAGNVTSTVTTTVSGTLNGGDGSIFILSGSDTPLSITGTFNANTSTVVFSGSSASIVSTTFYNLTINGTDTLIGNVTSTNVLTINSGKSLDASTYTVVLSATGTPFVNNGTFTSASSTVNYSSAGSVTTTADTYWNLILGAGTYAISDNTTSTNSFINNGTTTIASGKTLSAPGTFDNNGIITETGVIIHAMTSSTLSDSLGTEKTSYNTGTDTVYITVRDDDGNLNASSVDTIAVGTGSVITTDGYNDSESITSITLTETGVDTGIFVGTAYPFQVVASKTNNNSKFDVSGSGTLTLAFVDDKDTTDTGSDTAGFTGSTYSAPSSGGGGGGGSSPVLTIPTVLSATAIQIKGNLTQTPSQKITLLLSANNAAFMALSNASDFAGASWEAYSPTKDWLLSSGNGDKNIFVKFRSASGGETAVYSTKIALKSDGTSVGDLNELVNINNNLNKNLFSEELSDLMFTGINNFIYAPYAKIKFSYAYKNSGEKTKKIKIVRQLLNSKGKVIRTTSANASLKSGASFKRNIAEWTPGPVGNYTVKIRILDTKNTLITEKIFSYGVVKPVKIKK